ncbi:MAG: hypothetical protein ACRES7_03685 [Gammaproteobacteria bacterium]
MAALTAGSVTLGACASQPGSQAAQQKTAQQNNSHMVCFSTNPIGSHIAQTQCMTEQNYADYKKAEEKQAEAERAKLQQQQQQGATGAGGDGGTLGGGV